MPKNQRSLLQTLFCAALLSLASLQPARAESVLNFPRLSLDPDQITGVAIFNPNGQAASLTFTAYGEDGAVLSGPGFRNPATALVFAGQRYAALTSDIFGGGLDASTVAWFQATSTEDNLDGFFLFLDAEVSFLDGADLPIPSRNLIFDDLRFGDGFATELTMVNPNPEEAHAVVEFGESGMRQVTIPAMGAIRLDGEEFLSPATAAGGGAARAEADRNVLGFHIVRGPRDAFALNARPAEESSRKLFFPQIAVLPPFQTTLEISNASDLPTTLTIAAFDAGGRLFSGDQTLENPVSRELEAGQTLREDLAEMFGFSGQGPLAGWLRVDSSDSTILGAATYSMPEAGSLASVSGIGEGSTRGVFAHIATALGFFTGTALLNASSVVANTEIVALRPNGEMLGSLSLPLSPGERVSRLIHELIPEAAGQAGGVVWVNSDVPLRLTSLFGQESGVLSNIPPQSVPSDYRPDEAPEPPRVEPVLTVLSPGQSQAFQSTGLGTTPTWLVNGVAGGNAEVGTITSLGVYQAPDQPPQGAVTVSARRGNQAAGATVDLLPQPESVAFLGVVQSMAYSPNRQRIYAAELTTVVGGSDSRSPSPSQGQAAGTEIFDVTDGSRVLLATFASEEIPAMISYRTPDGEESLLLAARSSGAVLLLDLDTLESTTVVSELNAPRALTVDPVNGDLLVAESDRFTRVAASRLLQALTGPPVRRRERGTLMTGGDLRGIAVDACREVIYLADAEAGAVREYDRVSESFRTVLDGLAGAGRLAVLYRRGLPCPAASHLLSADPAAGRIRLIRPADGEALDWLDRQALRDLAVLGVDASSNVLGLLLANLSRGVNGEVQRLELSGLYRSRPER